VKSTPGTPARLGVAAAKRRRVDGPNAASASTLLQPHRTSSYRGVGCWNKQAGRWFAQITHEGRQQRLGSFADEADAARAYDARARQLHGAAARLNFPQAGERQGVGLQRVDAQAKAAGAAVVAARQRRFQSASSYYGVGWRKQQGQWTAKIYHEGRQQHLGLFTGEADAARAYDVRARQLKGAAARLNFPQAGERQGVGKQRVDAQAKAAGAAVVAARQQRRQSASAYRGVGWNKHTGRWVAEITHEGRKQHLGLFTGEADAARAYDVRARQLKGAAARLNFPQAGERQGVGKQRAGAQERTPVDAATSEAQPSPDESDDTCCAICLENVSELELGTELCVLGCTHEFCYACIDGWFQEGHRDCPTCRAPFVSLRRCRRRTVGGRQ
jgi:hypothetical protein